jgi:maltose alpha-D-glucosyltransferase/alpha-amylase
VLTYWYQDAILYELDVKTFQDGNGDGIGDFPGLKRRLPYLAGLGVTCIWLRPFYPSPLKDDGYDVADYYAIDPRLGTFGDFVLFLREARELGLRVITDLVLNHTSDEHPWFQQAREDPHSPYRDWYIWSQEKPKEPLPPIFPGAQDSTWTYDRTAKAYFHHRFFPFQPDLNMAHPAVREEVGKVMAFWLELGLSGFRLDAAPFLLEQSTANRPGELIAFTHLEEAGVERPYGLLRELRRALSWCRGDAVFLAEANVGPELADDFFGPGGERMHLLFNFLLNQQLMLALARQQAAPLADCLNRLPDIPPGGQWVTFLRNHDELDLARLSDAEREEVYAAFGPDPSMRAYDRGIRRRLAPMLDGDLRRVALAHSLLLSLPGAPMLRYGEELGMGEDLSLADRMPVRTPMPWCPETNAGFSAAPADRLIRPVVAGGPLGYERVNVAAQQDDPDSPLSRVERMVRVRQSNPEFARGRPRVLDATDPAVFAQRSETESGAVVAVHNLADRPARVRLVGGDDGERLVDLLHDRPGGPDPAGGAVELPPFGYRWFRVVGPGLQNR